MKKRQFLSLALASGLGLLASGLSLAPVAAADQVSGFGGPTLAYEPGLIQQLLDEGKTVFVDYHATWCSTCAAQKRQLKALREADPAYDEAMTFVAVDWDDYGRHDVTRSRNIPRRSTLVLLRGDEELGRLVAQTGRNAIKGLMDQGL